MQGPLDKIVNDTTVCSPYAHALARDGVAQSVTLLKNAENVLPLDAKSLATVAVIGPLVGDSTTSKLSSYYGPLVGCGNAPFWVGHHKTMIDAVKHYLPSGVSMHCGVSGGFYNTTTGKMTCVGLPNAKYNATSVAAAAQLAAAADVVIVVVGSGLKMAAEGNDISNISFPDGQAQLIEQVAAAAKKPIVVVTVTVRSHAICICACL